MVTVFVAHALGVPRPHSWGRQLVLTHRNLPYTSDCQRRRQAILGSNQPNRAPDRSTMLRSSPAFQATFQDTRTPILISTRPNPLPRSRSSSRDVQACNRNPSHDLSAPLPSGWVTVSDRRTLPPPQSLTNTRLIARTSPSYNPISHHAGTRSVLQPPPILNQTSLKLRHHPPRNPDMRQRPLESIMPKIWLRFFKTKNPTPTAAHTPPAASAPSHHLSQ